MYSNIFKCCHPTKLLCSAEFGLASPIQPPRMHLQGLNSLGFYTNSEQLCLGLDAEAEDPQAAEDPQDDPKMPVASAGHHCNFLPLTGSGVFALASGFNHSCESSAKTFAEDMRIGRVGI